MTPEFICDAKQELKQHDIVKIVELLKDGTTEPVDFYMTEADAAGAPDYTGADNAKPFAEHSFTN